MWLMVVAIAGLSFVGYVAIRLGGARRGVLFAGIFGGLVSSTATSLALSRMARNNAAIAPAAAAGVVAAWVVMCARVALVVHVLDTDLGFALLPAIGAMAGVGVLLTLWFLRLRQQGDADAAGIPQNPFEIGNALRFALLLGVIMLASRWVETRFGATGLEVLAVISGMADVDAITLSVASGSTGAGIGVDAAARVIVLAAVTNNLVKGGLGAFAGGRAMATRLVPAALLMAGAAAVASYV
ncbi:MAG: DUF4010 domain-containing protein, partial [Zavarzinia sp.]|nr:DUF4010 domain-containing protein [Zavarzinia sp.]